MGVIIPQVVTEDRAGGAQVIDGSLRFDGSKSQYLSRTIGAGSISWTYSGWVKRNRLSVEDGANDNINYNGTLLSNSGATSLLAFYKNAGGAQNSIWLYDPNGTSKMTASKHRDVSSWYHIVANYNGSVANLYVNGTQINNFLGSDNTNGSGASGFSTNGATFYIGRISTAYSYFQLAQVYFIDGQALDPSSFGYTDPLTNTWRPKKYTGTYGTNGFYLPLDGNTPIGQDQSGRGNNWTPVNFGGSNTIEKATGALPILNTDGGGKVARVGVRTDSSSSSLVLALPLVGIKSDFSNAINSGTSNKAITNTGVTFDNSLGNFYGGSGYFVNSEGDFLSLPYSSDFDFTTGNWTIEGWIYHTSTVSGGSHIFGTANGGIYSVNISVINHSGYPGFCLNAEFDANSPTRIRGQNVLPLNQWVHFAVVKNSSTISLYQDGIFQNSTSSANIPSASGTVYVGRAPHDGGAYKWNGYLQDLRIYKGLAKYTQNFIPASTDPDILPDTPSGVAYSSNVALVPSTDGAVAFDGSGDYLQLAYSSDLDFTGEFTLEGFVYPNASTGDHSVFGNFLANATGNWGLGFDYSTYGVYTVFYYQGNTSISNAGYVPIPRAWNHYAVTRDASNVIRVFLNGQLLPTTATYSGTLGVNAQSSFIGFRAGLNPINGFISNVHWVKGTCLYTSNFTPPTAPITSVANTKLLCCKSNSSAIAFDVSPGSITANGNAVATNFNPFTVNINTQRGQESGYATLNPLRSTNSAGGGTISNGNLDISISGSNWYTIVANIVPNSGKWYAEFTKKDTSVYPMMGVIKSDAALPPSGIYEYIGYTATSWAYQPGSAVTYTNNATTSFGSANTTGTSMVAFDADTGKVWFGHDGNWIGGNPYLGTGASYTGLPSNITFAASVYSSSGGLAANFGQKPFKFPPPAGFQPLALANIPRPGVVRPDQFVGVATYTGNTPSSQSVNVGFKPDFVWLKVRNAADYHQIYDSVRGATKYLHPNVTDAEATDATALTAFTNNGFTVGSTGGVNSNNMVAWAWKAGGSGGGLSFWKDDIGYSTASAAGLTAGTITPTGASVNTKSGFSIIKYSHTINSSKSIPHGLTKAPEFMIAKFLDGTTNWNVYHAYASGSGGGPETGRFTLNGSGAYSDEVDVWNDTLPTNEVWTVGGSTWQGSGNHITYLWHSVPGFSKFGSYVGNLSADGSHVHLGFRPKMIIIRRVAGQWWFLYDSVRYPFNQSGTSITPYISPQANTEGTGNSAVDFLSNGFKLRVGDNATNDTVTFAYAAWAESPSFNLYGGQSNAR